MTSVIAPGLADRMAEHQLALPGMDGYTAERLTVSFGGGVELVTNDAHAVEWLNGLRGSQDVTITVTATVKRKGFVFPDEIGGEAGYGVSLKVHSIAL
jgi:hypothetical protein